MPVLSGHTKDEFRYLLNSETKILEAISAQAPVPETLNEICCALDRQIGNVVSLISTCASRRTSAATIARTAARFGLHVFSSADILNGRGEETGSLEVYCCVPRDPSTSELRLMERARHLAALAMEREAEANCRPDWDVSENRSVPERVLELPDFLN